MSTALRHPECGHAAKSRRGRVIKDRPGAQLPATCRRCEEIARKNQRVTHRCGHTSTRRVNADQPDTAISELACSVCEDIERAEETERRYKQWREWYPGAKARIQRELRRLGFRAERRARKSSGSTYYTRRVEEPRIRISDHHLPSTPEREHNWAHGRRCADYEIVLDHVQDIDELLRDLIEYLHDA